MSEPHSKHFSLSEWEKQVGKIPEAEPYPMDWVETRWRPLAETLDAIRDAWGTPIFLTPNGGYRAPKHNLRVDGKARSQHMEGRAADIRGASGSAKALHTFILAMYRDGKLPRLGGLGLYPSFVHVDVRPKVSSLKLAQWGQDDDREQVA